MDNLLKKPKTLAAIAIFGLILIICFFKTVDHSQSKVQKNEHIKSHQPFDVASGDTNNEVLKSIVARQQAEDSLNKKLIDENKKLELQNSTLQQKDLTKIKNYVQQQINSKESQLNQSQDNSNLSDHEKKSKSNNKLEYPVNNSAESTVKQDQVITSVPDLSSSSQLSTTTLTTTKSAVSKESLQSNLSPLPSDSISSTKSKKTIPYYTIPDGATAGNAVLLSPLVGEVPVNGQLLSPAFPFKAIISYRDTKNMFAANGVPLPTGISGTILQGYSVGDMSLGCARAYVMKILFVFHDGHYVVFPKRHRDSKSATQVYPNNSIGYLSDAYNNSCISGKYITDAPKVIASLAFFGGAAGAGGAIAQSQTQTIANFSTGTAGTIINGNLAKYAGGIALGEGSKAALAWYQARINGITDF